MFKKCNGSERNLTVMLNVPDRHPSIQSGKEMMSIFGYGKSGSQYLFLSFCGITKSSDSNIKSRITPSGLLMIA